MTQYERQQVPVSSLQDGDVFELPRRRDVRCKVSFHKLMDDEDGRRIGVIGFNIIEGSLGRPWISLPADYPIWLLLPTTTYVHLGGKDWMNSLTEQHGVKD